MDLRSYEYVNFTIQFCKVSKEKATGTLETRRYCVMNTNRQLPAYLLLNIPKNIPDLHKA